jgi:hypothetical protein
MKVTITTSVVDGKMTSNRELLSKTMCSFEGMDVDITIEKHRRKRSNPQNSYLHGAVLPIIRNRLIELGINEAQSKEWVFDFVKANCLVTEIVNKETGEVLKSLGKSSALATWEFNEFIERIQQYCSDKLSLYIPNPGEYLHLSFD